MPLTRVEVEEVGVGRFVAEVEHGGGSSARRELLRGDSRAQILARVAVALGCQEALKEELELLAVEAAKGHPEGEAALVPQSTTEDGTKAAVSAEPSTKAESTAKAQAAKPALQAAKRA